MSKISQIETLITNPLNYNVVLLCLSKKMLNLELHGFGQGYKNKVGLVNVNTLSNDWVRVHARPDMVQVNITPALYPRASPKLDRTHSSKLESNQ